MDYGGEVVAGEVAMEGPRRADVKWVRDKGEVEHIPRTCVGFPVFRRATRGTSANVAARSRTARFFLPL